CSSCNPPPQTGPQVRVSTVVSGGGGPIVEMGAQYRLDVDVVENDPQLISGVLLGSVTEAVDPITQRFGDFSLFPSSQFTDNLSSGTAQDFFQPTVLGPQDFYKHSWNWLGRIEGGCAQLLANFFVFGGLDAVVAAQFEGALGAVLTGSLVPLDAAITLVDGLDAQSAVVLRGRNRYFSTVQDVDGTATKTHVAVIEVPRYKRSALRSYFVAAIIQGVSTAVGIAAFPSIFS